MGASSPTKAISGRPLPKKILSVCQGLKLLSTIWLNIFRATLCTLLTLIRLAFGCAPEDCDGVEFFEGFVTHARSHEGTHSFRYKVRMAIINLDSPPKWWTSEPVERLSADEARKAVGSTGQVLLLTTPSCAGYDQNPIQVYYCYEEDGSCRRGICEVTNTPWNHRVYFTFELDGAELPKPLHVSPLMDLSQKWQLRATPPGPEGLQVWVDVFSDACPITKESKALLRAHLQLTQKRWPHARAERAGSFNALLHYGLQPHRTAIRIYANAVLLLRKGVKFRGHPPPRYKKCVLERGQLPGGCCGAGLPWWTDNSGFPWGPAFAGQKAE
eukprot:gnl/TRDRNA2_/TRDRNA2_80305_c0_seq1.p1 gnl/TRDRNA2_/TRDRNA2_80305_c0~~gnl/TRDRNA2_/TRDRNA2_80305_c0_seq1.p1  ORF type:complete len:328 (+),score=27.68 gnl/TRDRNA2_/TRDRNA2_80305_c0_seq1:55-1038(+)